MNAVHRVTNSSHSVSAVAHPVSLTAPGSCLRVAPSKEVLSYRAYTAHRRLNRLRRGACRLYESDAIARVVIRLEREVEHGRIAVRSDKKVHADVGKLVVLCMQKKKLMYISQDGCVTHR